MIDQFSGDEGSRSLQCVFLPALRFYQRSLPGPNPPSGAFDVASAGRGEALFNGKARCGTCHVPPLFTEPGWNLHKRLRSGLDDFQAKRGPDDRYVTAKLRALWDNPPFYHDGRFATLTGVVNHYDNHFQASLTEQEKAHLIEYLKSI